MEFLYEMAFVVIACLIFSLIEAFLVLPGHLGHSYILRTKDAVNKSMAIRCTLDKGIAYVRDQLYGRLLKWMIRWHWYVVVFLPVALIILTAGLIQGGLIKFTFFPAIPFDYFSIDVAFTPGTGEKNRITSYNVCYTKLLRNLPENRRQCFSRKKAGP